jgi:hypothetical protein
VENLIFSFNNVQEGFEVCSKTLVSSYIYDAMETIDIPGNLVTVITTTVKAVVTTGTYLYSKWLNRMFHFREQ